ncbi:MAG TPA: hypothetical protein VNH64_09160 [Parvularculaceae bacterium]|nr:hypothetical protein [Parvularculaceae bacterium]
MASVAEDAELRVRTLIALTEELTAIFVRENALLAAGQMHEIAPMQEDKARLAAAYCGAIREVATDRAVLDGAGEALLDQLRTTTADFERRAAEQHALLRGDRSGSPGLRLVAGDDLGR